MKCSFEEALVSQTLVRIVLNSLSPYWIIGEEADGCYPAHEVEEPVVSVHHSTIHLTLTHRHDLIAQGGQKGTVYSIVLGIRVEHQRSCISFEVRTEIRQPQKPWHLFTFDDESTLFLLLGQISINWVKSLGWITHQLNWIVWLLFE